MTSNNTSEPETVESAEPQRSTSVDQQLIEEPVGRAQAEGLQLTGEGGLLQQLIKRLLESALEGETTAGTATSFQAAHRQARSHVTTPCSSPQSQGERPLPAAVGVDRVARGGRVGLDDFDAAPIALVLRFPQ